MEFPKFSVTNTENQKTDYTKIILLVAVVGIVVFFILKK